MSGYEDFRASLAHLLEAGQRGEPLDLDAVSRIAGLARTIGPGLDDAERREVTSCIGRLGDIVREGMAQVEAELSSLGDRRVGIRGYGQLRSTHTGQRLRRRA
jgi:hypothetical protein